MNVFIFLFVSSFINFVLKLLFGVQDFKKLAAANSFGSDFFNFLPRFAGCSGFCLYGPPSGYFWSSLVAVSLRIPIQGHFSNVSLFTPLECWILQVAFPLKLLVCPCFPPGSVMSSWWWTTVKTSEAACATQLIAII